MQYGLIEEFAIAYEKLLQIGRNIFSDRPNYKTYTAEEIIHRFDVDRQHCSAELIDIMRATRGVGYRGRSGKTHAVAAGTEKGSAKEMR